MWRLERAMRWASSCRPPLVASPHVAPPLVEPLVESAKMSHISALDRLRSEGSQLARGSNPARL